MSKSIYAAAPGIWGDGRQADGKPNQQSVGQIASGYLEPRHGGHMAESRLSSVLPAHEASELFRLMAEGIRETAVFLMDPDGVITVWNKAAEQMKGYTAEEAIGSYIGVLYTDADQALGHPAHNLGMAEQYGYFSEETWRKRKDGSLFFAHVALTALRAEDGRLLGFSKVTLDLTRHKLLEQCEQEKHQIDLVLQAAEAGTWKWNTASDTVVASHHFFELLGYGANEGALPFEQWLDFIGPEDQADARKQLREAAASAPESMVKMQLRLQRKDGSHAWFIMRANWHWESEDERVLMGVCVDIDQWKQEEQEKQRLFDLLGQERKRFADILEQMPSGILLAEAPSGRLIYQNAAAGKMLGWKIQDLKSVKEYEAYPLYNAQGKRLGPEERPLSRTLRGEQVATEELIYEHEDGTRAHFAITTSLIVDDDGVARLAVASMHDIGGLRLARQAAATEKEQAQVTLAAIADGVVTTDPQGKVRGMNPAAERLLGTSIEQARGMPLADVVHFADEASADTVRDAIARCCAERHIVSDIPHAMLTDAEGQRHAIENAVAPVALADGELIGAVMIFHDITESKRLMNRLGFEASHDALTGLANRREFETRLQRTIDHCKLPQAGTAALLYMDLDQFKIVNDTCGHAAGDDLLRALARLYCDQVRERDTLARIGGDEFALIVEHCTQEEAHAVGSKILEVTRNFRFACNDKLFQPGVSIGLALIDTTTASVEDVMRRADHACYIAKERGRNRMYAHFLGDADFAQRRTDMHWATRISHALEHDELQLYYQPIVALNDGARQLHYEILLRMKNGGGAPISPAVFLPAAERYDVIANIDRWVLSTTLWWLAAHPQHVSTLEMCSINLSRRSLGDRSFHQFAADLIDASPVPAEKLCFEITENGAIADMQSTICFINSLSARGCRFSLDDFGTGMTSFAYLKQLPVDFIKIDGSFIQMMSSSDVDFEMVRFTNDISHMMGRQTIAEYVTDQAIVRQLQSIGVDFAQGYWVGEPRPLESCPQ
jgi:diguanylate cyclase (GGDEF)-like protein/PAS domain S-box-containing protein